jgi:hypothetical protein
MTESTARSPIEIDNHRMALTISSIRRRRGSNDSEALMESSISSCSSWSSFEREESFHRSQSSCYLGDDVDDEECFYIYDECDNTPSKQKHLHQQRETLSSDQSAYCTANRVWLCHLVLTYAVILAGVYHNQSARYVEMQRASYAL